MEYQSGAFTKNMPYALTMPPPPIIHPRYQRAPAMHPSMMPSYPFPHGIPPEPDPFIGSLSCWTETVQCLTRGFCCCFLQNETLEKYKKGQIT
ncbi:hypothetical protein BC940DRAFT_292979 [Gongronella butleri]|nr:hypothetical protein BC940DRAFT_292979 [Gongronella butleri]